MEDNNLKVSVIMNVHNGEKYISHAIRSVLNQTYSNFELVIWDNLSIDKTFFLINKFNDSRIKYFKSDIFETLYAARNKAIKMTTGSLITFLDVDDLWLPHKLQEQIKVMQNPNIEFCYSNFYQIGQDGLNYFSKKAYKYLPSGYIYDKLISKYKVGILTLCIRRETLSKKKIYFDPRFSIIGDMVFVLKLSKLGAAYADQNCLACYRSHRNNLSKRKVLLQVREMRKWFSEMKLYGNWNEKEFKNLVSLTCYQRAKGLANRLKLAQIIKITFKINNFYLIVRFLAYCFYKFFYKLFIQFKKKLFSAIKLYSY